MQRNRVLGTAKFLLFYPFRLYIPHYSFFITFGIPYFIRFINVIFGDSNEGTYFYRTLLESFLSIGLSFLGISCSDKVNRLVETDNSRAIMNKLLCA